MAVIDKPQTEITARDLLAALDRHGTRPLVFFYEGRPVRPGYHVTEVKTGRFTAIDCGVNPEAWTETFIQLWDVDDGDRTHMTAAKFVAIINKVAELSPFEADTKLTFEVSDGIRAMQLFQAANVEIHADRIAVDLTQRPASCKPRDRWLAEQQAASCCTPGVQPCCGTAA